MSTWRFATSRTALGRTSPTPSSGRSCEEIALGLVDLGVEPGDRVCILAGTRPEWSYVDMAITATGAVVVPIYPTNSPEECHWVISDSGACAIVCENAEQLAKVAAVREQLPELRTVIVIDPPPAEGGETDTAAGAGESNGAGRVSGSPIDARPLAEVRERGRSRAGQGGAQELERRRAALRPEDPYTFIYTSGTTGPPKGCVLSHGNYRDTVDMVRVVGQIRDDEVSYLFLPLAHAFALLIQLGAFDRGSTIAYFGGDVKQIVSELQEVQPTFLPSVPRIFEKIYTLAHGAIEAQPPRGTRRRPRRRSKLGAQVRDLLAREEPIPEELRGPFEEAEEGLFKNVRSIFGGHMRQAATGAAPIAPRDPQVLLGLRRAGAGGVRDDRDLHDRHRLHDRGPPLRHRGPRAAGRAAADRRGRRDPDQGRQHLPGLPPQRRRLASARSRTAGCTPATSARSTRTATSRSRGARRTSSSPPGART